ncbi:hypothetical protein EXIGLDRAFT_330874 [Exidia glandulosa HHB12029]|uniref:Uncharacterized protein n=1 Tax=Exidia glandulosa HHB12029 TaxID=1314781 RepID=A0A165CRU0_EXIGL|nr:hypothetical protein EXIGLDRAFT_330874 [Exidia glandulosa HHB12029]
MQPLAARHANSALVKSPCPLPAANPSRPRRPFSQASSSLSPGCARGPDSLPPSPAPVSHEPVTSESEPATCQPPCPQLLARVPDILPFQPAQTLLDPAMLALLTRSLHAHLPPMPRAQPRSLVPRGDDHQSAAASALAKGSPGRHGLAVTFPGPHAYAITLHWPSRT